MVKIILININTTPLTIIIFIDRDNTKSRINPIKMVFPKVIRDRFSNNECFSFLFSIFTTFSFLILTISCLQASKYFPEFFFHTTILVGAPIKGPRFNYNLERYVLCYSLFYICFCLHRSFFDIARKTFCT